MAARPAVRMDPPMLSSSTADRARSIALAVGERLLTQIDALPRGRGLAGDSGFALVFSALAHTTGDVRYLEAAHRCMRQAANADDVPSIGLVDGISGLRAVAALLAPLRPEYRRLIDQCDAYVEKRLPDVDSVMPSSFREFDIITGWSGARLARCVDSPSADDRLVELLEWLLTDDARWRLVHPALPQDPPENDIGVAHGIAGVLAAVALTAGATKAPLACLLRDQVSKLMSYAVSHEGRVLWHSAAQGTRRLVEQRAWCYGTPGTAAALYWAGRALCDETVTDFALNALRAETSQPAEDWLSWDRAICHGTLGCALIFASVGSASACNDLIGFVEPLVRASLDDLEANENAYLGMLPRTGERVLLSELDGAAGMALALLTLAGANPNDWVYLHALRPWK